MHVGRVDAGDSLRHRTEDVASAVATAALTADEHQRERERDEAEPAAAHFEPPVFSPGSFRKASIWGLSGWCDSTHVTIP